MLDPKILFEAFIENKINFFAGVPDSLLKNFCSCITDYKKSINHIIAANEGAAISLGIGYHLASNKIPLVYMQNSGLGNAINPLTSLADPEVYSIPMIIMIGWRGEPGKHDEPQHKKQGLITLEMLDVLNVSYRILDSETSDLEAKKIVQEISEKAIKLNQPVALVVKKGVFSDYKLKSKFNFNKPLMREAALELIISQIPSMSVVVATTGMLSRELFELRESLEQGHEKDFLTVGGMGHASQIALGIALQKKNKKIFCLDGDGSAIMHMGSLAINAASEASNFLHIILNNSAHDSVGGQPTLGGSIDIRQVSKSLGYSWARQVETKDEIIQALQDMQINEGPALLEIQINIGHRNDLGRPTISPVDNKLNFMRYLNAL